MDFTKVATDRLYIQVANQLREAILEGQLLPGDQLPAERELAESFGVSRASIREAVRTLEAEGLLTAARRSNRSVVSDAAAEAVSTALTNVIRMRGVSLTDLVELRCATEGAAVSMAAERQNPEGLEDAGLAVMEMELIVDDTQRFHSADLRFHLGLVKAAGNEAFMIVMVAARDAIARYLVEALELTQKKEAVLRRLTREHKQILEAVTAGDGVKAAMLMDKHISRFYREAQVHKERMDRKAESDSIR